MACAVHSDSRSVWCAVLCCGVLCCGVLCCAVVRVLCCAVVCCAVVCCGVLCCGVLWCAVLCCAVVYCGVLCCGVLCSAVLWCAVVCVRLQATSCTRESILSTQSRVRTYGIATSGRVGVGKTPIISSWNMSNYLSLLVHAFVISALSAI